MADHDDVRTRVEDAMRRAAATAYEAAHGAIDERDDRAPSRWRWVARPRVAVTAFMAVALVGALIAFMPHAQTRAPTSLAGADGVAGLASAGASGAPGDWEGSQGATTVVTVHVAGAVAQAGVYELPAGSRVDDAVDAAGGPVEGADTDGVNLARILVDGEQIRVPIEGEHGTGGEQGGLINVNTGDADTLEGLPGVGPVLAERIVTYREAHGPFASVDALDAVSGVGPAVLEQIRAAATV